MKKKIDVAVTMPKIRLTFAELDDLKKCAAGKLDYPASNRLKALGLVELKNIAPSQAVARLCQAEMSEAVLLLQSKPFNAGNLSKAYTLIDSARRRCSNESKSRWTLTPKGAAVAGIDIEVLLPEGVEP